MIAVWPYIGLISGFEWPKTIPDLPLEWLAVIFGTVGLLIGARLAAAYLRRLGARLRPLWLFSRIGAALGLDLQQRWWLWRVAKRQGLASPLTLLMSPATLEFHASQYAECLDTQQAQQLMVQITRIRRRLFD